MAIRISKSLSALALAAVVALSCPSPAARPANGPQPRLFDPARLSNHTRILASDDFQGREPGTIGETRAVRYIIEQFRAAGAVPAGENGGWTQKVAINHYSIEGRPQLRIAGPQPQCSFDMGDAALVWVHQGVSRVSVANAPLVFVGHGIDAPAAGWNDYQGVDVRGKVVVALSNDPDYEAASGPFEGSSMTYYGRIGSKAQEAARKGAVGLIVVNHPSLSGYGWELLEALYSAPIVDIPRPLGLNPSFESYVRLDAAERLFRCAGLDLEQERVAASKSGFKARTLSGLSVSTAFSVKVEPSTTSNVLAMVRGSRPGGEHFIYSAHWDHMGIGKPDSTGDRIYNGAMDNAAGVAGLIELARAFAHGPKPKRSLLFIATTLEERGLLGAEHYAAHPVYKLDLAVGGINMDAVNVFGHSPTMEMTGIGKTDLEDMIAAELSRVGRKMQPDPNATVGFYFRSDHFPFVKRGVPFIFAGSGWDLSETKAPNVRDPQVGTRFHTPSDEWSESMDFAALAEDLLLYQRVGSALANNCRWPKWKPGAEFIALRPPSKHEPARERC